MDEGPSQSRTFVYFVFGYWTVFLVPLIAFTFIVPIVCYLICWVFLLLGAISISLKKK